MFTKKSIPAVVAVNPAEEMGKVGPNSSPSFAAILQLALQRGLSQRIQTLRRASLEDLSHLLRIPQRKPYGTMEGNVKKALKDRLEALLKCIKDQDPDTVSVSLASSLDTVAELDLYL
ncbi:hypothetical protein V6N13_098515 [Hibiscus sabdariffa]|uniref:Uncharacterized protein n=1 Tax=Hibiscus sabdariffa TaxID=183260 RepID=A0ABR2EE10_9ROSI